MTAGSGEDRLGGIKVLDVAAYILFDGVVELERSHFDYIDAVVGGLRRVEDGAHDSVIDGGAPLALDGASDVGKGNGEDLGPPVLATHLELKLASISETDDRHRFIGKLDMVRDLDFGGQCEARPQDSRFVERVAEHVGQRLPRIRVIQCC